MCHYEPPQHSMDAKNAFLCGFPLFPTYSGPVYVIISKKNFSKYACLSDHALAGPPHRLRVKALCIYLLIIDICVFQIHHVYLHVL